MPAAVLGPIIAAAIAGGTTIAGAKMAGGATKRAADISAKGTDAALKFEMQQAAEDKRRYDQEQAMQRQQWDAQQQQRAPFRAAAAQILSRRTGIPVEPYQPSFQPTMSSLVRPSQEGMPSQGMPQGMPQSPYGAQQPPMGRAVPQPNPNTLSALVRRY